MEYVPILTEDHYVQIKNALDVANLAQLHIEQAQRAGIDVSAQAEQLRTTRDKLLALKNVYFPGR